MGKENGKVALVTGADGGMGQIHTRTLAENGFEIVMACYDVEIAKPVRSKIANKTGATIHLMQVDLGDLQSVVRFCDEVKSKFSAIHILLNNAGVLANHCKTSVNNVEYTVAVNYLGHFALTNLLLPIFVQGTRIVNMISIAYSIGKIKPDFFAPKTSRNYNRFTAYGNSKLALYYFMLDAAEAWKDRGIFFNAADPDIVSTNIIRLDNVVIDKLCDWIFRPLINTPEQGAASMLSAALNSDYSSVTGTVFKKGKPIKHKKRFYNNVEQREMLRKMTLEILEKNDIHL